MLFIASLLTAGSVRAANEDTDYRRALNLYQLSEYQMAAEALAKYLADYPKGERRDEVRLLQADSCFQLKDYAQAAKSFGLFVSEYPNSPRRAEALQRAVKAANLAKDFIKSAAFANAFMAENTEKLKKPDAPEALRALSERVLYFAGDSCYNLKQTNEARAYWETLERDFPKSALLADAAEGLGWLAFDAGQFPEALKQFAITAGTPGAGKAAASQVMIARILEQQGKFDEALAALDKVTALNGGDQQAREVALWKALSLLKAGRYAEAGTAYKNLVQGFASHPDTPRAVSDAAAQTEAQNKPAEALNFAELFLASFPKDSGRAPVARMKVRALTALQRHAEAVAAAQAALKEAEAFAPGTTEYSEQRPLALLLLAETLGATGKPQYELLLKDHAASRCAFLARYQLACLAAQDEKTLPDALAQASSLLKDLGQDGASVLPQKEREELQRQTLFAVADFAFRLNNRDEAEKNMLAYSQLQAVRDNPAATQLPLVQLRLAWCRHGANDFAGAIALLDKALKLKPEGELRQEMLYLRGRALLDSCGVAGATAPDAQKLFADFSLLLKEAPTSSFTAHACYDAAQYLFKQTPEAALPWLEKLIGEPAFAESPLRLDAILLRARIQYGAGKNAETLASLEGLLKNQAFQKTNSAPGAMLLQGLCLEAQPGKEAEAEKCYTELLAAGTDSAEAKAGQLRRAKLRFNAKHFQEAQADLETLLGNKEIKPENAADVEAAVLLADCHKELKDTAGAQARLEKLASLALSGPAAFEVPFQLGNLAYEGAHHAEAAAAYQKALAAAAQTKTLPLQALSAAWLNLAWSQKHANEPQKAAGSFAELLKLDPLGPFSAEARYQRGRLLAETGAPADAMAQWKELLEKQADNSFAPKALCGIAETQAKANQFSDGAKTFETYLEKYPAGEMLRDAWCGLAECRLQLKNYTGAREAFLKALGDKTDGELKDEQDERAVVGMAEMALEQNDAPECKKQGLRVVLDRPDSKWLDAALYLCGRASEAKAEPNMAIGYYRKLLAERPKSERIEAAKERLKALGAPID
jgi:TolA-binding protein